MKNQEALEVLAQVLQRCPLNKAEVVGVNVALEALREKAVVQAAGRPDDGDLAEFPRQ